MDDPRIKDTIASGKTCYFISPHYDDMAYSAGVLASKLAKTNKVVVITIFTTGSKPPYTRAAKKWMERCGYSDADSFFADRSSEDKRALRHITNTIIDLEFADGPWRHKAGQNRLLRYYYAKTGNTKSADPQTFADVQQKLYQFISDKNVQIFCPLGIGKHFDHLLTRQVCDELHDSPIYWSDYPYALRHKPRDIKGMRHFAQKGDVQKKRTLIEAYTSQYRAMFGAAGPRIIDETYYYKEVSQ